MQRVGQVGRRALELLLGNCADNFDFVPLDRSHPTLPRCAILDNYSALEIVLDLEPRTPEFEPWFLY